MSLTTFRSFAHSKASSCRESSRLGRADSSQHPYFCARIGTIFPLGELCLQTVEFGGTRMPNVVSVFDTSALKPAAESFLLAVGRVRPVTSVAWTEPGQVLAEASASGVGPGWAATLRSSAWRLLSWSRRGCFGSRLPPPQPA